VPAEDFRGERAQLGFLGAVDLVGIVFAPPQHRLLLGVVPAREASEPLRVPILSIFNFDQSRFGARGLIFEVGRDGDHAELVDFVELFRLGERRAGHARELRIQPEVVLQGDGRVSDVVLLDGEALFRLHRLVQPVRPPSPEHLAPGELVHDDDLAALDQVIFVALEEELRAHGLLDVAEQPRLFRREFLRAVGVAQRLAEDFFEMRFAHLGERDAARALVNLVVFRLELPHDFGDLIIQRGVFLRRAGDDERGAGLVNQDIVHLVHDGEVALALDARVERVRHVVAQVVEAELVVRPVDDVGGVGLAAIHHPELMLVFRGGFARRVEEERLAPVLGAGGFLQHAHRQPEHLVDRPHPARVAAGEVVVDGDDVHAAPGERVEIRGERRDERLAFARAHLRDFALVQGDAADELHVEVPQAEGAHGGFAHRGEGLGQ
jgi:hypothetical protein